MSAHSDYCFHRLTGDKIVNVCVSLTEFPYIRYYFPTHHAPLGPLKPHATTRAPPPAECSGRWRTNLARGQDARAHEAADSDYVSRILAFMVQQGLDEYKRLNPDFAVSPQLMIPHRSQADQL